MIPPEIGRCLLFVLNRRGYGYAEYECGGCGACANCMHSKNLPTDIPWINNSGLYNSCAFVVDMLNASGIPARLVQINGEGEFAQTVKNCGPSDVVIEAFFVSPKVLNETIRANPHTRFYCRNHSEITFLAYDSVAMAWTREYLKNPAMHMAANSRQGQIDFQNIVRSYFPHWDQATLNHRVALLPNYHPVNTALPAIPSPFGTLNVGCFGALRPLKNQLLQAICASEVSRQLGKKLRFHVNGSRIEHAAGGVSKNLKAFFAGSVNGELVEHPWLPRPEFLGLVRQMDIGMQVSLSETFNLVTADFVTMNRPVLVSTEVDWVDPRVQAGPTDSEDIIKKMRISLRAESIIAHNRAGLIRYDQRSQMLWKRVFGAGSHGHTVAPETFVARPALVGETHR